MIMRSSDKSSRKAEDEVEATSEKERKHEIQKM